MSDVIFINVLLQCNDISLNPGPNQRGLLSQFCNKHIGRSQENVQCSNCNLYYHLRCLDTEYEQSKLCRLCGILNPSNDSTDETMFSSIAVPDELVNFVKRRGLKIIHQNVQSLRSKINELRLLCTSLQNGIHILTLSETWLNESILDSEISIPGYNLFRLDRGEHGGGVAVYARKELSFVRRDDLEMEEVEGLWLELFLPKSRGVLIGTFYRPPNTSKYHDSDFMSKLEVELSTATSTDKEVIILGDFNCDLLPTRSVNAECKQLKSLLKFMNFNQLIKKPTRINQTTATLLDLIATNGSSISFSGLVGVSLGDHEMVLCTRKVNWRKLKPKTRIFRNYSNYNHVDFCDDLNKIEWEKALNPTADGNISVDGLWANFKDTFLSVANVHAPLMEKRVRGKPSPWISGELKRCIRERDYQLRKTRRANKNEDWAMYKSLRNSVTRSIKRAKSN